MGYHYDRDTVQEWAGGSSFRAWRADLARFRHHGYSGWGSEGFWALTIYRMQRAMESSPSRALLLPARVVLAVVKKLVGTVTHINLPKSAEIGPGLLIPHVGPIQVTPASKIGADCTLHHTVTLAATDRGAPSLGDHVMVGCHVVITGPVTVGNGAWLGAGAAVSSDVSENEVVVAARSTVIGTKAGPDEPLVKR